MAGAEFVPGGVLRDGAALQPCLGMTRDPQTEAGAKHTEKRMCKAACVGGRRLEGKVGSCSLLWGGDSAACLPRGDSVGGHEPCEGQV